MAPSLPTTPPTAHPQSPTRVVWGVAGLLGLANGLLAWLSPSLHGEAEPVSMDIAGQILGRAIEA